MYRDLILRRRPPQTHFAEKGSLWLRHCRFPACRKLSPLEHCGGRDIPRRQFRSDARRRAGAAGRPVRQIQGSPTQLCSDDDPGSVCARNPGDCVPRPGRHPAAGTTQVCVRKASDGACSASSNRLTRSRSQVVWGGSLETAALTDSSFFLLCRCVSRGTDVVAQPQFYR